ncbi:MAG: MaoC family dehydratase N-terminal domain-containing protein [Burkholderiaceae bacterium]
MNLSVNLSDWIGRTESVQDIVTATPIAALAATFNRPASRPANGESIPNLWHWLYFLPIALQSELGADGHPKRGGFLPPVPQPRRMWAGSQFEFLSPLRVGDNIERQSTIENVTEKTGRSGTLVFVRVKHVISREQAESPALIEFHDIVYRDAPQPGAPQPQPVTAPDHSRWSRRIDPDDVLLFRFSALTFNGHRIHYDRQYVTREEGYPGLVVHGPLIAMLLLDAMRHELGDPELASFQFRAIRPTFDINHFFVCGQTEADGKTVHLWAKDHDGYLTMDATAVLR